MDIHHFLRSRRSIRRFLLKPVEIAIINRIIETSAFAPSAHNRQPWRFAIITNQEKKFHLSELLAEVFQQDLENDGLDKNEIASRISKSKNRINSAPVVIILCMDLSEMDVYPDDHRANAERIMTIQSVAAAGLQLQLAARAEGLDTVWTCSPLFAQSAVQAALQLPKNWEPQAMFFLGYAAEGPKEKTLKPLQDIAKFF